MHIMYLPHRCEQTQACEKITFPQVRLRAVKSLFFSFGRVKNTTDIARNIHFLVFPIMLVKRNLAHNRKFFLQDGDTLRHIMPVSRMKFGSKIKLFTSCKKCKSHKATLLKNEWYPGGLQIIST